MAARNTISQLTSRIEDLAERRLPRRGPVNIVGADEAECRKRLEELEAAGQRPAHVRFIMTGVPRSESFGMANKELPVAGDLNDHAAPLGCCPRRRTCLVVETDGNSPTARHAK